MQHSAVFTEIYSYLNPIGLFKKLPRLDKGNEALRHSTFTDAEMQAIRLQLATYVAAALQDLTTQGQVAKFIVGHYLLIASITGLRRGEQVQLRWQDIEWLERQVDDQDHSLIKITVRGETSKVRKTRTFMIQDTGYFEQLWQVMAPKIVYRPIAETLIFSTDGQTPITVRAISYHFDRLAMDTP